VNIKLIALYDAFLIYAHVINESLAAGGDPRDGRKLVNRVWNRTYPGEMEYG
jgi:hypothetical protein